MQNNQKPCMAVGDTRVGTADQLSGNENPNMPRRLYPYSRCSSGGQEEGDSFRRQGVAEYLEEGEVSWSQTLADRNRWIYDDTYALVDRGKSGYHKKNLTPTAGLTRFLNLVKDGTIAANSAVLAVERLDRLTRQEIMGAARLFLGILETGVWIATKDNDRVYKSEGADMMTVLEPLWIMYGSWVESNKKSAWMRSAWSAARRRQEKGEALSMGPHPPWLCRNGPVWEVVEDKADIVRRMHRLAREKEDSGFRAIARRFQSEGVPVLFACPEGRVWTDDSVGLWLTWRYVLGEDKHGKRVYPAIMTEEEWQRTQNAIAERRPGRGRPVGGRPAVWTENLFRGLVRDANSRKNCHLKPTHTDGQRRSYLGVEGFGQFRVNYETIESMLLHTLSMLRVQDVSENPGEISRLELEVLRLTGELTEINLQINGLKLQLADRKNARIIPALAESLDNAEAERQTAARTLETLKLTVRTGRAEALAQAQTLAQKYASARGQAKKELASRIRAALPAVIDRVWVQAQKVSERRQIVHVQVWLRSGTCRYVRLMPHGGSLHGVEPWDCSPESVDFRMAGK